MRFLIPVLYILSAIQPVVVSAKGVDITHVAAATTIAVNLLDIKNTVKRTRQVSGKVAATTKKVAKKVVGK